MKKDTDSNYKSRSLQKYSGSHSTRKDNPRKDFPKKESSSTSYERKEPVSYGSTTNHLEKEIILISLR